MLPRLELFALLTLTSCSEPVDIPPLKTFGWAKYCQQYEPADTRETVKHCWIRDESVGTGKQSREYKVDIKTNVDPAIVTLTVEFPDFGIPEMPDRDLAKAWLEIDGGTPIDLPKHDRLFIAGTAASADLGPSAIAALQNGKRMTVTGQTSNGGSTTVVFSLAGLKAAYWGPAEEQGNYSQRLMAAREQARGPVDDAPEPEQQACENSRRGRKRLLNAGSTTGQRLTSFVAMPIMRVVIMKKHRRIMPRLLTVTRTTTYTVGFILVLLNLATTSALARRGYASQCDETTTQVQCQFQLYLTKQWPIGCSWTDYDKITCPGMTLCDLQRMGVELQQPRDCSRTNETINQALAADAQLRALKTALDAQEQRMKAAWAASNACYDNCDWRGGFKFEICDPKCAHLDAYPQERLFLEAASRYYPKIRASAIMATARAVPPPNAAPFVRPEDGRSALVASALATAQTAEQNKNLAKPKPTRQRLLPTKPSKRPRSKSSVRSVSQPCPTDRAASRLARRRHRSMPATATPLVKNGSSSTAARTWSTCTSIAQLEARPCYTQTRMCR